MKIFLTGCEGQLGRALNKCKPRKIVDKDFEFIPLNKSAFNLENIEDCKELINRDKPDWIINSAAFTNVDLAERNKNKAIKINSDGPRALSYALSKYGGNLLHISTDFVFNGKNSYPYKINAKRNPINLYGLSKTDGEKAIEEILVPKKLGKIIRTSWLIGSTGRNFARTIVKLLNEKPEISVVADQVGSPTSTTSLAKACWKVIILNYKGKDLPSHYHFANSGVASWYDLAVAIGQIGKEIGLIKSSRFKIIPIKSSDYPTPANRPSYSVLDCFDSLKTLELAPLNWRDELSKTLREFI